MSRNVLSVCQPPIQPPARAKLWTYTREQVQFGLDWRHNVAATNASQQVIGRRLEKTTKLVVVVIVHGTAWRFKAPAVPPFILTLI